MELFNGRKFSNFALSGLKCRVAAESTTAPRREAGTSRMDAATSSSADVQKEKSSLAVASTAFADSEFDVLSFSFPFFFFWFGPCPSAPPPGLQHSLSVCPFRPHFGFAQVTSDFGFFPFPLAFPPDLDIIAASPLFVRSWIKRCSYSSRMYLMSSLGSRVALERLETAVRDDRRGRKDDGSDPMITAAKSLSAIAVPIPANSSRSLDISVRCALTSSPSSHFISCSRRLASTWYSMVFPR